jgi:iron(III) transport system substrate-binding protein
MIMQMHTLRKSITQVAVLLVLLALSAGCQDQNPDQVVVYTSVDQVFSEPILDRFQVLSGIEVLAVYDVEAAKTTGLVNRLISEKNNPQADVFWNGEFAQTLLLQQEGVLTVYHSPNAGDIPDRYKDTDGYWTGFGGRARVLIINSDLLSPDDYPTSITSLVDPAWPGDQIGMAYPLFGTTATQAAALYAYWGVNEAESYYRAIADRGVQILDGNSVVRDQVVSGKLSFGMTDTDDACTAILRGDPVEVVFPDQGTDDPGTLIIPNTVALIAGGPHPENGKKLIDYLLSVDTARSLMEIDWTHLNLRDLENTSSCYPDLQVKGMTLPLGEIYPQLEPAKSALTGIFIR